jgi:hypothetical protein
MKKLIINILPLLTIICSLSSCLKGDSTNIDTDKTSSVIEFANTGNIVSGESAAYHRFTSDLGVLNIGDSATFNVNIHYAGAAYAPTDITVNLEVDTAALSSYNATEGSDYIAPPASVYSFPSTVVIKSGTLESQIKVTIVRNSDFDFAASYALPLKIASVSTGIIGSNYGTCIYSFSVRNQYDGVYDVTGNFQDFVLGDAATSSYPKTINLVTYGPNSVGYFDPSLNGGIYGYSFKNGGSGSYYGNFAPIFTLDDGGNVTSVTNYYGQGTNSQVRSAELDPSGINKMTFDGTTPVKLEVSYFMIQAGATRLAISEVFTYTGAR